MACSLTVALYILQQAIARILPPMPEMPLLAKGLMVELGLGCYSLFCAVLAISLRAAQPRISKSCLKFVKKLEPWLLGAANDNTVTPQPAIDGLREFFNASFNLPELEKQMNSNSGDISQRLTYAVLGQMKLKCLKAEQKEIKRKDAAEHARNWRVLDILMNAILFIIYAIAGITCCLIFLFGL